MSASWGSNIELTIFGESHGKGIGIVIGNLPAGLKLDEDFIKSEMKRRAPGQNKMSTPRVEKDAYEIMSGVLDGYTTGAPLCAFIPNTSQHSKDYSDLSVKMRPGHSDYPAYIKYKGFNDIRGGGHFSGRLTAPIVFAGAIAKQLLAQKDIYVGSHVLSIKDVKDDHYPVDVTKDMFEYDELTVLNKDIKDTMKNVIDDARMHQTSVGGKIECAVIGLQPGLGNPFFDSIESHISPLLFSIPACKSVSFGDMDDITNHFGHEVNDNYYYDNDSIKTYTNHNGGITGGISNGMPIVLTVGIKPTPSVSVPQKTVNIHTKDNTELVVNGRHDPCIVPRACVVVESMVALGLVDMMEEL